MLALSKLKTLDGLALLTISRFNKFKKLLMSSFFGEEMSFHSACLASTMSNHSSRADCESAERRWLKKALMAMRSGSARPSCGMRRTSRPDEDDVGTLPSTGQHTVVVGVALTHFGDHQSL